MKLGKKSPDAVFPGRDKIVGGKMDDITVVVAMVQEDAVSGVGGFGGSKKAGGAGTGAGAGGSGKSKL